MVECGAVGGDSVSVISASFVFAFIYLCGAFAELFLNEELHSRVKLRSRLHLAFLVTLMILMK